MKKLGLSIAAVAVSLALAGATTSATASHGRGAVIVPSVDAQGVLTLNMTSFWRQTSASVCQFPHDCIGGTVTGPGGFSQTFNQNSPGSTESLDLSDSRRAEVNQVNTLQLGAPGLYTIDWGSCCWVSGVPNASGSYGTQSTIFWDGENANTPIVFDIKNIQQEVERGVEYTENMAAIAGSGLTLSYGETTSGTGVSRQPDGFSVDQNGVITITEAGTLSSDFNDNNNNPGADVAFDHKITATDSEGNIMGSLEFYWVFDAVDSDAENRAPNVADIVVNAIAGSTISETVVATDPDGDEVTLSFVSFFGPGGLEPGNSSFDPETGLFQWDSTGFDPGQYVATILGTDGSLTDQGTITINLAATVIPLPPALALLATALVGLGGFRLIRRRRGA